MEETGLRVLGKGEMGLIVKLDWEKKGLEKLGEGFGREKETRSCRGGRVEEEGKAKFRSIVGRRMGGRRVGILNLVPQGMSL